MLKISNRQQALEEICNKFTDEFRVLLLYIQKGSVTDVSRKVS